MILDKIKELASKIDYTIQSMEERKKIADDILSDPFIIDYLSDYTGILTSDKGLAESDAVFSFIDRVSNYILNSEECREDNKNTEYKIYYDENAFNKALQKEVNIDGMGTDGDNDNIIHFLKNENRNFKKSKTQVVNKKDITDERLSDVLEPYDEFLKIVTDELKGNTDTKLSRFQLSRISGSVKQDMIDSKESLLGVFGYNSKPSESTTIDWDMLDFSNHKHVRALLYLKPSHRNDEELMYIVQDFDEKLKNCKLSKDQWEVITMLRHNIKPADIARQLEVDRRNVDKKIKSIVSKFVRKYGNDNTESHG